MTARPLVLGIGGPSCGGKTTLARHLAKAWGHLGPALFRLDSYYRVLAGYPIEERARFNFDHPDSLDWELMLQHLGKLAKGRTIMQPVYDYEHHTRSAEAKETGTGHLVIVDGIFALHGPIPPHLDLAVYVELAEEQCLARRIERDVRMRAAPPAAWWSSSTPQCFPCFTSMSYPPKPKRTWWSPARPAGQ
jgi:uridine kinase